MDSRRLNSIYGGMTLFIKSAHYICATASLRERTKNRHLTKRCRGVHNRARTAQRIHASAILFRHLPEPARKWHLFITVSDAIDRLTEVVTPQGRPKPASPAF